EESDPAKRVVLADRLGMDDADIARLITRTLGDQSDEARRIGLGTAMFLRFRDKRNLPVSAWEPLARLANRVLVPRTMTAGVRPGQEMESWMEITRAMAVEGEDGERPLGLLERNFLQQGYPGLWDSTDWISSVQQFRADLDLFEVVEAAA
ncbi:MAG: hypothetical protein IFK94_15860, partial [Acidobacteria bacterium]|nr:hypothetical protein [Candidatus Polarisedimenticola svalbardensis]